MRFFWLIVVLLLSVILVGCGDVSPVDVSDGPADLATGSPLAAAGDDVGSDGVGGAPLVGVDPLSSPTVSVQTAPTVSAVVPTVVFAPTAVVSPTAESRYPKPDSSVNVVPQPPATPVTVRDSERVENDSARTARVALLGGPMVVASLKGGGVRGPSFRPEAGGAVNPNDRPFPLVYFEGYGVNPFVDADEDRLSTFSLDGDTASFEIARSYLEQGFLPDPDSVRVEEWVNAFTQGYGVEEDGLGLRMDAGPSPFGENGYVMLRVGVVSEVPSGPRSAVSLIIVVDVSGSMEIDGRLETAKALVRGLVGKVGPEDRVGLVTYGNVARVVHPITSGVNGKALLGRLVEIQPGGSTHVEAGIQRAFKLAADEMEDGRSVRMVVLSDGVGNLGHTGPESILAELDRRTSRGVSLTTIGVGLSGNYNDVMLEVLANRGNGTYHYVRGADDVVSFLSDRSESVFREVARDARVQVEFNPDVVRKYRLIGYENRSVRDDDFRNDTLDFGEVGFARDVTALYELRLFDDVGDSDELALARVRWTDGRTGVVSEVSDRIVVGNVAGDVSSVSRYFVRAMAVAEFAELMRRSYWSQCSDLAGVAKLLGAGVDGDASAMDKKLQVMLSVAESSFEPYCRN